TTQPTTEQDGPSDEEKCDRDRSERPAVMQREGEGKNAQSRPRATADNRRQRRVVLRHETGGVDSGKYEPRENERIAPEGKRPVQERCGTHEATSKDDRRTQ